MALAATSTSNRCLNMEISFAKQSAYICKRNYDAEVARRKGIRQSLHNFTKRLKVWNQRQTFTVQGHRERYDPPRWRPSPYARSYEDFQSSGLSRPRQTALKVRVAPSLHLRVSCSRISSASIGGTDDRAGLDSGGGRANNSWALEVGKNADAGRWGFCKGWGVEI